MKFTTATTTNQNATERPILVHKIEIVWRTCYWRNLAMPCKWDDRAGVRHFWSPKHVQENFKTKVHYFPCKFLCIFF